MNKIKKSIFIIIALTLISCNVDKTPKCNDDKVKKKIVELFVEKIKPRYLEEQYQNINLYDLRSYCYDNELNFEDELNSKKEEIKLKIEKELYIVSKQTSLINIRTNKIDKELNKCECASEIQNPKKMSYADVYYSVQKTEDSNDNLYYEIIDYKFKNTKDE